MANNILEDRLPYWHHHQDYMVFMDGSLGIGFKINGADISALSNESINNLNKKLETLLVSTDEGIKIQFVYDLSANVTETILAHKELSQDLPTIYAPIANARFDQIDENAKHSGYYNPTLHIFIRNEARSLKKKKFWQKQEQFEQITQTEFQDALFLLERQIRGVQSHVLGPGPSHLIGPPDLRFYF